MVRSPLMAARATFALKAGEWFRRGRLLMVSPVHGDYRRCQAEIPLIVLCRFPGPAVTPFYMALHAYQSSACITTSTGALYEGTSSDNHKDKWDRNLEYA